MYTIERSNKKHKKKEDLFFIFKNEIYVSFTNAKKLLENESITYKEIFEKVDANEIELMPWFTQKGDVKFIHILTKEGFIQLTESMKHGDKRQNGVLAIGMMESALKKVEAAQQKTFKKKNEISKNSIINVMDRNGFKKERWEKLYDTFSRYNNIPNVRYEAYKVTGSNMLKSSTLDYTIYKYPYLLKSLYEIAKAIA